MQRFFRALTSRIRNKIVLPYLLLAIAIAVAMTFVAVRLTVGALQERIDNRLIEAGQATSDALVTIEDEHLTQLRAMAFTQGVDEAIVGRDTAELTKLLQPYWFNSQLSTLVVFDTAGQPLLSWQRTDTDSPTATPATLPVADLPSWWIVQQIVQGRSDIFGDKFSVFWEQRLFTAAPVKIGSRLVGGLMVGLPIKQLMTRLQERSQASVTTFYNGDGQAVATTQVLMPNTQVPSLPDTVLPQLRASATSERPPHLQSVVSLNGREYQFAYSPLQLRRAMNGFFAVGVSRKFLVDTWASERLPLLGLAGLLLSGVIGLGVLVSRRITRPLQDLVTTAQAVSGGDLDRRSPVASHDEVGLVAEWFNQMTERLLQLYTTSRNLSAQNRLGTIMAETAATVQALVPAAEVVALLCHDNSWQYLVSDVAPAPIQALRGQPVVVAAAEQAVALAQAAPQIVVAGTPPFHQLFPAAWSELCVLPLTVQGQTIGILAVGHADAGQLGDATVAPLATTASMAATALRNTLLYLDVQTEGARRQVILESIADGVVVCDADEQVVLMNAAAETLLQITDWASRRYHFSELPLQPLADDSDALMADTPRQERVTAHGQTLSASRAPLVTAGVATGSVVVLHNISEEMALSKAKTDLIAMISHDCARR